MRRLVRAFATATVLVLLVGGCGGAADRSANTNPPATATAREPAPSEMFAVVAHTLTELPVYASPSGGEPTGVLAARTPMGSPRALLVTGTPAGSRVEIALPTRPNGATAWVDRDRVELRAVHQRLVVDLAARTLILFDDGVAVLSTPVAVGSAQHPTPTGQFFVTDRLRSPQPGGAYGPYALGLSAHSETLSEFAGGDGQIGIHGTDNPASIGQAVSHGCIRLPNDVVTRLATTLALGTPVTVVGP